MSDTVIRVENLGKKYIVGHQQQACSNLSWENQSQQLVNLVRAVTAATLTA